MSTIAVCAFLLAVIAAVLVVHEHYEDGLIGRIALGAIVLMGIVIVGGETSGVALHPLAIDVLLLAVLAFFVRHAFRFFRWRTTGRGEWRGTDDRRRAVVFWPHELDRRSSSKHRSA